MYPNSSKLSRQLSPETSANLSVPGSPASNIEVTLPFSLLFFTLCLSQLPFNLFVNYTVTHKDSGKLELEEVVSLHFRPGGCVNIYFHLFWREVKPKLSLCVEKRNGSSISEWKLLRENVKQMTGDKNSLNQGLLHIIAIPLSLFPSILIFSCLLFSLSAPPIPERNFVISSKQLTAWRLWLLSRSPDTFHSLLHF